MEPPTARPKDQGWGSAILPESGLRMTKRIGEYARELVVFSRGGTCSNVAVTDAIFAHSNTCGVGKICR
jgi:hypothetical protein